MSLLKVAGLGKSFGGVKAVDGVSFEVAAGELLALIGPNGAGKTTTFAMMVGYVRPDGGHILLDGRDVTDVPMYQRARSGIGYLALRYSEQDLGATRDAVAGTPAEYVEQVFANTLSYIATVPSTDEVLAAWQP